MLAARPDAGIGADQDTDVDQERPERRIVRVRRRRDRAVEVDLAAEDEAVAESDGPPASDPGLSEDRLVRLFVREAVYKRPAVRAAVRSTIVSMDDPVRTSFQQCANQVHIAWVRSLDVGQFIAKLAPDVIELSGTAIGTCCARASAPSRIAVGLDARIFTVTPSVSDAPGRTLERLAERLAAGGYVVERLESTSQRAVARLLEARRDRVRSG